MDAVLAITLGAALFIGTHISISSAFVRPRLVAAIGEQPYRGVYSIVAFATFIPLIIVFAQHKHAGPMLWYLRGDAPIRWLSWVLMFTAFVIFVAGLMTPSPAGVGGASGTMRPRGILKLTRHPGFVGFALFGVAHILMNGWLGDVVFFGSFPALGILGGWHQDRRKLREIGDSYRAFMAETSFFPGAALVSGRQRWDRGDMPWSAVGIGATVTVAIVLAHPWIFGGHPLG